MGGSGASKTRRSMYKRNSFLKMLVADMTHILKYEANCSSAGSNLFRRLFPPNDIIVIIFQRLTRLYAHVLRVSSAVMSECRSVCK